MKKAIKLIFLIILTNNITNNANAQEVKWFSFEEAVALNKKNPRKIMIDIYTDWCSWCKIMDKQTFHEPTIVKILNEKYYCVKFNAETTDTIPYQGQKFVNSRQGSRPPHQLAINIMQGKMSYPTIAFMAEDNNFIAVIPGFQKPKDLEPLLVYISASLYKQNIDFEKYKNNYNAKSND